MLKAEGLACVRGERIVFRGLDFSLSAGEAMLLVGPNGVGKSSLLRLIAGLIPIAEGRLAWDGAPVADDPDAHRARLAYVGHLDALKPAMTLAENLGFWARLAGAEGAVETALARFDLADLADLPARFLSAGQRRRLGLARLALDTRPLWLLDEPSVSLDVASVSRLAALVAEHRARGGMVLAASHVDLGIDGASVLDLGRR
jgi:heme exporter protein A